MEQQVDMLVLIQHPHDWTIEPVAGDVWGRDNLQVNHAGAVSKAHFKIVSVDDKFIRILHTGRRNGLVFRSGGGVGENTLVSDAELVTTDSEVSLGVNDKYFFMDAWRSIYFLVDEQVNLGDDDDDDDDDVIVTTTAPPDEIVEEEEEETLVDKNFIDPDDGDMSSVCAAAASVVRAIFSRVKKQQPMMMNSGSTTTASFSLVSTQRIPKLQKMMDARLKQITFDAIHDDVDKSSGFGPCSGFHSSTRIRNEIVPAPLDPANPPSGRKRKQRKNAVVGV